NDKSKPGQRDSYIPSTASLAAELGLPTSNYNSMGIMEDFLPVSAVEADNKVNTDSFVTEMSK
nr:hypothetical protein [Butyrivibrio sp.]